MNDLRAVHPARDDWEDWSDSGDTIVSTRHQEDSLPHSKSSSQSIRRLKQPASKLQRLRSRKRQKHQNEKLGIRLVTDMSRFRKGPHHVAQLVQASPGPVSSETHINKFADASALRALEGSPNLASVGNWAWLKDKCSPATPTPDSQHFSPDGNKIVIGMAMPEQDARTISPRTATVATPTTRFPDQPQSTHPANPHQNSTWSPDTEDGYSPASQQQQNIYGHFTGPNSAHPVPAVPSHLKNSTKASEVDDDDDFTPVTLFEEDGTKSPASAVSKISPETTRSRSGWWDHVKTPFKERFSPTSRFEEAEAVSPDEWWKKADKKTGIMSQQYPTSDASSSMLRPIVPIIREPSPAIASSSRPSPPAPSSEHSHEPDSEKAAMAMEKQDDPSDVPPPYEHTPSSKQDFRYQAVFPQSHYLASQFSKSQMPGSPDLDNSMAAKGAVKSSDMKMSDVPLTPARTEAESTHSADAPLPDRVAGTYVGDHHQTVCGASPAAQIEKTRRRHEKEDYLARKAGGFGKGRACLTGCYGRSGREGRQRRRCWLIGCLIFLALIIIGVVVGVVVSRDLRQRIASASATSSSSASGSSATSSPDTFSPNASSSNTPDKTPSVWLNLTSFPPIPTGLSTVVGPDNSEAISGCVAPKTLWSCSLPPEEQAANEPSDADQPMFIFQIQYDNSTRMLWDIPNGDAPTPATATPAAASATSTVSSSSAKSKTSSSTTSVTSATATDDIFGIDPTRRLARRDDTLYDTGIAPDPAPPSYEEMWFLGNWTDGIVSGNKSGEPTPFYISFFTTLTGSAGANTLNDSTVAAAKRDAVGSAGLASQLPAPLLNADGTGQAAQLRPFPYQQPLRLFDRGLPTEHYGFYSYFNKTVYVASMDNTTTNDEDDGGVRETSAAWYATWTQTRFVVKIWTQKGAAASLIGGAGASASNTSAPGTFPYPITVGEDTHGGDLRQKLTFAYGVEADQVVNTTQAVTFVNDVSYGGEVVNAGYPDGDLSWGGTDGGTGGCRCEWVNWVDGEGVVDELLG